jgi:hypothetical protein
MSDLPESPLEKLLIGITFIFLALIALHKARLAIVEHTPIRFKFALVSPAQASIAATLSLAVGLYFVIVWWRERRPK